jgi:hypothetical protein
MYSILRGKLYVQYVTAFVDTIKGFFKIAFGLEKRRFLSKGIKKTSLDVNLRQTIKCCNKEIFFYCAR